MMAIGTITRTPSPYCSVMAWPPQFFLTTGAIDSRQALWFEQLAGAIKKSSREYLDLEIDIPRRFWMRTHPERLDANGRIFGVLRQLADVQRRQWMDHILKELAVPIEDRATKMLTWDEVRLMKSRGIDF